MKTYTYATDSEHGEIKAKSLESALEMIRPTDAQIEDGAWAWVEDKYGERIGTR